MTKSKCEQCGKELPLHPWSNKDGEQYQDTIEHQFCSEECVDASYQPKVRPE